MRSVQLLIACSCLVPVSASRWQQPVPSSTSTTVDTRQTNIALDAARQVSSAEAKAPHREVTICADPIRPERLLIASMYAPTGRRASEWTYNTIVYSSGDAGSTWTPRLRTPDSVDPACAFGDRGVVYFVSMTKDEQRRYWDPHGRTYDLPVWRSADWGETWTKSSVIHTGLFLDRPWVTVDGTDGSFRGRVYVSALAAGTSARLYGDRPPEFRLFTSRDGGRTFADHVQRSLPGNIHNGTGDVSSLGEVVLPYFQLPPTGSRAGEKRDDCRNVPQGTLTVFVSSDGGRTVGDPVIVSPGPALSDPCHDMLPVHQIPTLQIQKRGVLQGRIYVAWIGLNSGRAEVLTAFSDDGARHWSQPKPINDDEPLDPQQPWRGPHHDFPALATNDRGVVAVMWYDRRDVRHRGYLPRVSASVDGGETWTASVPLTATAVAEDERFTVSTDYLSSHDAPDGRSAVSVRFGPFEKWSIGTGDTAGLAAAADGRFHAVWIDDRTGVDQVWTRSFAVEGGVRRVRDVTDYAKPEILEYSHEPSTRHVSLQVRIRNVSTEPMTLPLTIEFVGGTSSRRTIHALNPDSGRNGVGATWTFTGERDDTLLPGETTLTRTVRVTYRDTGPELWSLAGIRIRVLAPVMR